MHKERFDILSQELKTITGEYIYIGNILKRAAEKWPLKIAIYINNKTITYSELYFRASDLSLKLQAHNITTQDKVILLYENSIEFYISYFAVLQAGAIIAPLNTFLSSAEIEHILHDAQPKAIIVSNILKEKLFINKIDSQIITFSDNDINLNSVVNLLDQNHLSNYLPKALSSHELAILMYTSGTTGSPKGVMLSSHAAITNALQGISELQVNSTDRIYVALPLFHSLAQNTGLWCSILIGGSSIVVPKIDRKNLLLGLNYKPTIMIGVPSLYALFCLLKANFSSVRYFFCGGDSLSDKTRMFFELIYNRKLCNGYGLTEASPFISGDSEDRFQLTNTVGRPLIGISCQIRDNENNILPDGYTGVLWVSGENIMLGYYNAPEATSAVLKDGWLNTGDLAYIDKRGKIVLVGRVKDLIINKGLKIYPQEIENVLLSHPNVMYAAVIGEAFKSDSGMSDIQVPIAYVAVNKFYPNLEQELRELCVNSLATYKIPHKFIIKKELPLTSTGKVNKNAINLKN